MNIFLLDTDLTKCAQYHCDKHVVKMPTEYVQLLSSVMSSFGLEAPYKDTHVNHPCAIWARKHRGNYQKLYRLAEEVGKEYTHRYGKKHKAIQVLEDCIPKDLDLWEGPYGTSPLPNCTTYEYDPRYNLVDLYRFYYLTDKAHILSYKNREEPEWMGDRFYQQATGATVSCLPARKNNKPLEVKERKVTKADLAKSLGIPELEKLLVKDLQKLSKDLFKNACLAMPEGRLKKPYVEVCNELDNTIDWNKLTIAALKAVINKTQ